MQDRDPEQRSPAVVRTLVESHRQFLAFLERRVGTRAIAEDILQDAFARALPKVDQLRAEESSTAWFYRTLRNAVIDHQRRRASNHRALTAFAAELEGERNTNDELQTAVCHCISELANTLKPEYAYALKRVEVDGLAIRDYAAEVGISSNNAGVRVFRAREALRRQVARSCGTCAVHGCMDCTCDRPAGHCGDE